MALMKCTECGKEYAEKADKCPNCGNPNPKILNEEEKKKNKKWDIIIAILLFIVPLEPIGVILMWVKKIPKSRSTRIAATLLFGLIFAVWIHGNSDNPTNNNNTQKVGNISEITDKKESDASKKEAKNEFKVGDVVETSELKITFISAKKYKTDNQFIKPKKDNTYYRMEFEFENIGDSDETISSVMNWTCYADSYKVEQAYIGEDEMDGSISPGKKIKGAVYFEIPKKAKEITLEYETNFWTENKIEFKVK